MQEQFTDKARNALALAVRAAKSLHQSYTGTEHILLGLLKENTGVAARVLMDNGASEELVREMIRDLISARAEKEYPGYRCVITLENSFVHEA